MSLSTRVAHRALAGLAVAALGLTACSTGSIEASAGAPSPTATSATPTADPPPGDAAAPSRAGATDTSGAGPAGQHSSGFDGAAFQRLMAANSVPATSATTGALTTGAGKTTYTMSGNGISRIECSATAQAGNENQSDHDALAIASPFLEICGSYPQYGALKDQATQYVRTNLPTLQGESKVSTTVGAVSLTVGRAGPGNYFVTIINGG